MGLLSKLNTVSPVVIRDKRRGKTLNYKFTNKKRPYYKLAALTDQILAVLRNKAQYVTQAYERDIKLILRCVEYSLFQPADTNSEIKRKLDNSKVVGLDTSGDKIVLKLHNLNPTAWIITVVVHVELHQIKVNVYNGEKKVFFEVFGKDAVQQILSNEEDEPSNDKTE